MSKKAAKPFNYDLRSIWFSENEQIRYHSWFSEEEKDSREAILFLLDKGLKVSMTIDQNTAAYLVSVTVKPKTKSGQGIVFMFRHGELPKAILMSLFYLSEVLDWEYESAADDDNLNW